MDSTIFNEYRTLIIDHSGISLTEEKKTLLSNRITKRMQALNIGNPHEYLKVVQEDASGQELERLIDVVSTNVTSFYREATHFETLASILDEHKTLGKNSLRLWCAAASSGEEPYTLAITILEHFLKGNESADARILATDICTTVLRTAIAGCYNQKQVEAVPEHLQTKYFKKVTHDLYKVNPALPSLLLFKKLNLAQFPYPLSGPLDMIFCRNCMIYFERDLRCKIVKEFERLLAPGGHLFISHSENLVGFSHSLKRVASSVYQKPEDYERDE